MGSVGHAAASAVTPSVTGTVTQVVPSGNVKRITVNGHVYTVTANTKSDSATSSLQAGQTITVLVAQDGNTAMMIRAASSTATHP
jgi:hypothetical protein